LGNLGKHGSLGHETDSTLVALTGPGISLRAEAFGQKPATEC